MRVDRATSIRRLGAHRAGRRPAGRAARTGRRPRRASRGASIRPRAIWWPSWAATAVACGAIQALDIDTAETDADVRASRRTAGWASPSGCSPRSRTSRPAAGTRVLRLETGVYLPEAIALYLGRRIPADPAIRAVRAKRRQPVLREAARRQRAGDPADALSPTTRGDRLADAAVSALARLAGRYPVDPGARFVVATRRRRGRSAAAAIQLLDDRTAEIKHMYVRPSHRGDGLGPAYPQRPRGSRGRRALPADPA